MEACNRLGLVVIVAVSVLFCGVAEAGNPCYAVCFKDCTSSFTCMFDPKCIATCGITCGLHDTCTNSIRKVLPPNSEVKHEEEAVVIQHNTIEKNTVGIEAGNPCYGECVQTCLNDCGLNPWICASCPGTCALTDTCKHEDVAKNHVAGAVPRALLLNTHVAVADE